MLPHELHEPYPNSADRIRAVQQLLDLCHRLEELERLAVLPAEQWPPQQTQRFPTQMSGRPEHAAERLTRWHALFGEELAQAHAARDSAVRARLSDAELRTAIYLAARLLASAYGRGAEEVNDR
jgi:hypothetical protein